jgi:hypothetical protein
MEGLLLDSYTSWEGWGCWPVIKFDGQVFKIVAASPSSAQHGPHAPAVCLLDKEEASRVILFRRGLNSLTPVTIEGDAVVWAYSEGTGLVEVLALLRKGKQATMHVDGSNYHLTVLENRVKIVKIVPHPPDRKRLSKKEEADDTTANSA